MLITREMTEGKAEFIVPGLTEPCYTWYKTVGDLKTPSQTLLVVLHGGPGAGHDYLLSLTDLAVPLVFYDQIGSGRSTHLPEKDGDESFWTIILFINELNNLLKHLGIESRPIDLYGHSWGGMLACDWAVMPSTTNLRRLILSSSLVSIEAWRAGIAKIRSNLPKEAQDSINEAEKTGDFTKPEYKAAIEIYSKEHLSLKRPYPAPEVQDAFKWLAMDSSTHRTMYGPGPLTPTGALRNWTILPQIDGIGVPTLLLNGAQEGQEAAMQPFFDHIDKVKWIVLNNAGHLAHIDQRKRYIEHLQAFLDSK